MSQIRVALEHSFRYRFLCRRFFLFPILSLGLLSFGLSGCPNVLSVVDSPDGDAQLLSAARACFDEGDLECARNHYNQLSRDYEDIQKSELAYAILDENGAGMSAFIAAFGKGNGGDGLTKLANAIAAKGANATRRLNLLSAYQKAETSAGNQISDQNIRGLVRFISGIAIAAEILAETVNANGNTTLDASDLVASVSGCLSVHSGANCNKNAGINVIDDGSAAYNLNDSNISTLLSSTANMAMLHAAVNAVYSALTNDLSASGKFTNTLSFVQTLNNLGGASSALASQIYRYTMISNSVGAR